MLYFTSQQNSFKKFPQQFPNGILNYGSRCMHKSFHYYIFFTGFVAHHYNENIGIILTVKGEIVIFEKSVVFKQEGYHDWCKIDQVQQLTVGSYVKLRKHPSNVAEKVWSCHDFGTLEPSRPASTNVKGNFEFNTFFLINEIFISQSYQYKCLRGKAVKVSHTKHSDPKIAIQLKINDFN